MQKKIDEFSLSIRVQTNAKKNKVIGYIDNTILKIKIKVPPLDGKANKEIIMFFSTLFNISKNQIIIVFGKKNKNKIIKFLGVDKNYIKSIINKECDIK